MSRADVRRPENSTHAHVYNIGAGEIRQSLRQPLLGEAGEMKKHILEIQEFVCDLNQGCLTTHDTTGNHQPFFRVIGRAADTNIRDNGNFNYDELFLGEAFGDPMTDAEMVVGCYENEFTMYTPTVYSYQDLLWRIQKKLFRISSVLDRCGWADTAGELPGGDRDGADDEDTAAPLPGAVGSNEFGAQFVRLPAVRYDEDDRPLITLQVNPSGYISFQMTPEFSNSFAVWVSPLLRELTGWPELLCYTADVFGEAASLDGTQWEGGADNEAINNFWSTKTLQETFDERLNLLLTSDLPVPIERSVENGQDKHRFVISEFAIRKQHDFKCSQSSYFDQITYDWALSSSITNARQVIVKPHEHGFQTMVLPSIIPSFNFRCVVRRKVWDYVENKYTIQEVPLMTHPHDTFSLKMIFSSQE